jgi:hypothetical protein
MFNRTTGVLLLAAGLQIALASISIGHQDQGVLEFVGDVWVAWLDGKDGPCNNYIISDDLNPNSDAIATYTGQAPDGCGIPFLLHERMFQLQGCDDGSPLRLDELDTTSNTFLLNSTCYPVLPEQKTTCSSFANWFAHDTVQSYVCYSEGDGSSSSDGICTGDPAFC